MEKFVEQGYLYDFYGELLTERQQQVYESVVLEAIARAAKIESADRVCMI